MEREAARASRAGSVHSLCGRACREHVPVEDPRCLVVVATALVGGWFRVRSAARMRELCEAYWLARRKGLNNTRATILIGVDRNQGTRWMRAARENGIPRPRSTSARYLSLAERETIADGLRQGRPLRAIAAELGRAPSTVSRELRRNACPAQNRYGPFAADRRAEERARRPKPGKVAHAPLLTELQVRLKRRWSPRQISETLRRDYPGEARMQMSPGDDLPGDLCPSPW